MLGYMKRSSYLFLPPMDHGQENETIMMTIEGGKRTLHAGVDFENRAFLPRLRTFWCFSNFIFLLMFHTRMMGGLPCL